MARLEKEWQRPRHHFPASPVLPSSVRWLGRPTGSKAHRSPAALRPQRSADMPSARGAAAPPSPHLPGVVVPRSTAAAKGLRGRNSALGTTTPSGQRDRRASEHTPRQPSDWLFSLSPRRGGIKLFGQLGVNRNLSSGGQKTRIFFFN